LNAFFFLTGQPLSTDEFALIKFANPTEVGLDQGRGFVDFMTVERQSGFKS